MEKQWRWMLGMLYVVAVAVIWIVASFVVQSVVGAGVSPLHIAYICNSLFVVYLPIVEGGRVFRAWLERRSVGRDQREESGSKAGADKETVHLLEDPAVGAVVAIESEELGHVNPNHVANQQEAVEAEISLEASQEVTNREWSRREIAQVSLLICPLWFLAQFTFNLSLRYTSVTSNTILSSASSLFTFLLSLALLNEQFKWSKLVSVLLCMVGTVIVTLTDSTKVGGSFWKAGWGDVLCLFSAFVYALYSTLLRRRLPDEEAGEGKASTALFFGYLGLFNALLLGPVVLILHFIGVERFDGLTLSQLGLIIGKGLLDNVLSDYLWAKAVLLTTPTAATAGLTIQVPIAGVVDSVRGKTPSPLSVLGAAAVLVGFFGINSPATGCCDSPEEEDLDHVKQSTNVTTV
ncbi:uncharacterized vacuolar membrane protein YML018C [Physcomitrium patens]|uniref:EamA domain-containing protein n=1 Tax=Physcomitrium patens TaxID=3218 RepID=A9T8H8_PHYPA|nr:uncharacterized vacuolar membrane protein YML018C-like [Physcomitrium patens]PNR59760.1 hypothetical protein PHYPA_002552 [Physcomitrium patens]|eukprot:XP_024362663.1 uncharacterized vacuolar membrane protein YML018C-like [Physcomitrella patens]